jgi:hypothetical protein
MFRVDDFDHLDLIGLKAATEQCVKEEFKRDIYSPPMK